MHLLKGFPDCEGGSGRDGEDGPPRSTRLRDIQSWRLRCQNAAARRKPTVKAVLR